MKKGRWVWLLALTLLLALGCGAEKTEAPDEEISEVDAAIEAAKEAYASAEEDEDKLAILGEFLAEYPESEHTADVLNAAIYLLVDEMDRREEAYALVEGTIAELEDAEVLFASRMQLAKLHGKTGRVEELTTLARSMGEEHEFVFTDHYELMEIAADAEAWDLLKEQAEAGLTFATEDAYLAQYPEMTDEEVARGAVRRVTYCKTYEGWALANQGRYEEAEAAYAEAEAAYDTSHALLGIDETDLTLYRGKSLALAGKHEAALELLRREAVLGSDDAKKTYAASWNEVHGSEAGLEENLWAMRNEFAVPLPEFTLADYDGNDVSASDFEGKVLVLAAWNPG